MKLTRRSLLRGVGGLTGLALLHPLLQRQAQGYLPDLSSIQYVAPAVRPTYIHIFLYGGPSELGANLTNLPDIQADSLNTYPANQVTPTANGFWEQAGGDFMEQMVAAGDMSIYRTLYRRKDDSKGHDRSQVQNLNGNLDIYAPGMASTLAQILVDQGQVDPLTAVLPVISLSGESQIFSVGDLDLSPVLRPVAMDAFLNNPYSRRANGSLNDANDQALDNLSELVGGARAGTVHQRLIDAFARRRVLSDFISNLDVSTVPAGVNYPANNTAADRLRAAISVAIANPDTFFINLGSAGLGGWDAHSQAISTYTSNLRLLMEALAAAASHLRATGTEDRIIINVFGDFGRNVNLNDSLGWDHGNNQNLFTVGGKAYRTLGNVVGTTELTGSSANNRLFTAPAPGSPEFEPFSVASSVYRYFGVQNPQILTGEPTLEG